MRIPRQVFTLSWEDDIREKVKVGNTEAGVQEENLRWFGHNMKAVLARRQWQLPLGRRGGEAS